MAAGVSKGTPAPVIGRAATDGTVLERRGTRPRTASRAHATITEAAGRGIRMPADEGTPGIFSGSHII